MTLLRPEFLALMLLWLPFCVWWFRRRQISRWSQVMDADLLAALQPSKPAGTAIFTPLGLPVFLLLMILALSGPALNRAQQPTVSQGNLYVLLDSSLSMAIRDISPDRLTRAKRMVIDWSRSGLFDRTSVLTYSASAHVLTPLTSDADTLELQLQSLTPFIMPQFGNRADLAAAHLKETLAGTNLPGQHHLLWITDDIDPGQISAIAENLPELASSTLVPVGTRQGGPIPLPDDQGYLQQNDKLVTVSTDTEQIRSAAQQLGMKSAPLGHLPSAQWLNRLQDQSAGGQGFQDVGFWLLIPMALIWLFQGRQPLMAGLAVCFLLTPNPQSPMAMNLFENSEQQAFNAYQDGRYDQAVEKSADPMLIGNAWFEQQQYDKAAQAFAQLHTADAHFNRGNALVHAKQYEQALQAYEQALASGPHPGAEKNRALLEDFLKQQQSAESDSSGTSEKRPESSDSPAQNSNGSTTEKDSNGQQQSTGETDETSEPGNDNPQQASSGPPGSDNDQPETGRNNASGDPASERESLSAEALRAEQDIEAILNRLPAPEGSLLQKKFQYQYQQNPTEPEGTLW